MNPVPSDIDVAGASFGPVPAPASLRPTGEPGFRLTAETTVVGDGGSGDILWSLLALRTGLDLARDSDAATSAITLRVTGVGAAESYTLTVSADEIAIHGADAAGLFYGVHTLVQLVTADPGGWLIPAVRIEDAPRFAYRGVMLDVARHFFAVETVCALIDRAAALKLNALHLHLSDDQGWRLHLPSRPALTERGAGTSVGGDPGGFYTAEDYAAIQAHAAARHMIVVPEIDLPGHTHAVGIAYPELVEAPVVTDHMREIVAAYDSTLPVAGVPYSGLAVGFSSLRIGDPATEAFVTDVVTDLAAMTPGPYLHIGGDEALGTDPEDYAAFLRLATRIVAAAGKTPLAWHEAGAVEGLAPGTIGQYWGFVDADPGTAEAARGFVAGGGRVILSPADAIYLDMKYDDDSRLGLVWANGPTSVARAYDWEPGTVIDGIAERDILGVEAPLWTETIRTPEDLDEMVFPRLAAAAEAAWSPAMGKSPLRTWESFHARVGRLAPLWEAADVGFFRSREIPWTREEPTVSERGTT